MSEVPPDPSQPQEPSQEFSPYPRSAPSGGGVFARPPGIYFDAIGDAIQIVKQDVGTWVVAAFLVLAVSFGVSYPLDRISNVLGYGSMSPSLAQVVDHWLVGSLISLPFDLVSGAVSAIMVAGLVQMALGKIDGGPVEMGDLFRGFGQIVPMLIGNSLTTLATLIGFLLCLVPGFYLVGAFAFVPILIVRQRLGGVEAINASWEVLRPHAFPMFGLMFVLGLLIVLGVLACLVGVLFAVPVYAVTLAIHFRAFFPEQLPQGAQTRIGPEPPRSQW